MQESVVWKQWWEDDCKLWKVALWCMWERSTGNSVQCKVCKKRCSGVRGDLSRVAGGFRCTRCNGTIQEVDLAEDLMVDGETYECVKSFCYLGDTLDGADLAATARIKNGWMKFREILPFLTSRAPSLEMKGRVYASCVRSSMTYGSETRPLLVDVGLKFEEQRCR